jgi:hypothetical protein
MRCRWIVQIVESLTDARAITHWLWTLVKQAGRDIGPSENFTERAFRPHEAQEKEVEAPKEVDG